MLVNYATVRSIPFVSPASDISGCSLQKPTYESNKTLKICSSLTQCATVLTNLGEKMSDDEVDELLKAVDTSSGEINYTDLVRMILAN